MTIEQLKNRLLELHKPEAWKNTMVWSVWEDGEITLEKGGDLFGQRNLHLMYAAFHRKLPKEVMPIVEKYHGRLYVNTEPEALQARYAIEEFLRPTVTVKEQPETTLSFTIAQIFERHLWCDACDVLGLNEYCVNEGQAEMDDTVSMTEEQAREIGLID